MQPDLAQRAAKLEWAFYQVLDLGRLDELRASYAARPPLDALREAGGIEQDPLVATLAARGLAPATLLAVTLLPLIEVAWIDGRIQQAEREALLHAAAGHGFAADGPGAELLRAWLQRRPDDDVHEAWGSYMSALITQLPASASEQLMTTIVSQARTIARSSGGLLGLTRISASEDELLERLEQAFQAPDQFATLFGADESR